MIRRFDSYQTRLRRLLVKQMQRMSLEDQ